MSSYRDLGALQSGAGLDIGPLQSAGSTTQNVDPTALASLQSFGTVYIVVPGLGPAAITSQQSFGTVAITGGASAVYPASISTPRATGTPTLVGPIYTAAAPSRQSFGTLAIQAPQNVDPTAMGSQQAFGTVYVAFTQTVHPTALTTLQSLGTPAIAGSASYVLPTAIASLQAFGLPAIGGQYDGSMKVYVGGVLWPATVLVKGGSDTAAPVTYESTKPPTITSQTLGRWVLEIDLYDDTGLYAPARGQTILVTEAGLRLFAGCIQTVGRQRLMGTSQSIIYHVIATDKSGICDRRIVKATTFPVGQDVASVVLTLLATSLNGEGITTTPQSVPTDGSLGALTAALTFNYDTVTAAFNQIATLTGTIWYVDANGTLWFNPFSSLPAAPFSLSDTSANYRSLLVEETNIDYANTVYAVSNLNVLPGSGTGGGGGGGTGVGSNTETFVCTNGNIGLVFQISPVDGLLYPYAINTSLPIGTLYSVTVNGVNQVVVNLTEWNGEVPTASPQFGPFLWGPGGTTVSAGLVGPLGLPVGSTVVINYTPYTSNAQAQLGEALSPIDPATGGTLGTCGSGIYELAVQVKNVSTVADLNAIAQAELTKRNGLPVVITFQTDKPGLAPGQLLPVNCPSLFIDNKTFLIIYARGVGAAKELEFGSRFQWQIKAQSNEDPGNWYQWYASMIQQSKNGLPIYQYEDASFVLGSGSSIAGGLVSTNPYLVKRTGQLVTIFGAAGTPPTGQDLEIRFLVNGALIPGTLKIPGGSVANKSYVYTFPLTSPLYVFNTLTESDVITVQTSYVVTASNPTPASNVSATLRWRI